MSVFKVILAAVSTGILIGCASNKTIPMKIQSDPLGAYVLIKHKGREDADSEWIFLGNTPLTTQRHFDKDELDGSEVLVVRLLKDGYLEQVKEWQAAELRRIGGDDQPLFWNPKLVPSN